MSLKKPRHSHGVSTENVACGAVQQHLRIWTPASNCRLVDACSKSACSPYPSLSPPQNSWNKPKVHQTPFSTLKSTKLRNPQREEHSPMSPLFIGPERSDGMMAGKCSPSQGDSLHLRKETVNRLCFWTLQGSSSLDSLCPEFYTFCFSFLSYCHRSGKASVKCLCLTFLRWVSSPGTPLPAAVQYISGVLLIFFFFLFLWLPLNCVADLQISFNDIHVLSWTFLSSLCDLKKCLMK